MKITNILTAKNRFINKPFLRSLKLIFFLLTFLLSQSLPAQTISKLDSLKSSLSSSELPKQQIETLLKIAKEYRNNEEDSCRHYISKAIEIGKANNENYGLADAYRELGYRYFMQSDFEQALNNFFQSESIAKANQFYDLRGKAFKNIAEVYYRKRENDTTRIYALKAEKQLKIAEDFKSLNVVYNTLGAINAMENNYDSTIIYFSKAIESSRVIDDKSGMADGYQNMGIIYNRMKEYEKAIEQTQKSISINTSIGMERGLAISYYNLARQHRSLNQLDEAVSAIEKSIKYGEKDKYTHLLANAYNTYGNCLLEQEKYRQAVKNFKLAIDKSDQAKDISAKTFAVQNLGLAYEKLGKIELADKQMKEALALGDKEKNPYSYMSLLEIYSKYNENLGRNKIALEQFKEYHEISDSLFQMEKTEKVLALQTEFETAEKEKEIQILEKDNELQALRIQQQQRNLLFGLIGLFGFLGFSAFLFFQMQKLKKTKGELEVSLTEKATLLKEIHHRVKNNLQLIISLLTLQAKDGKEQTIEEFLYKGQNRVKTIALIHERLYRTDNLSSIHFEVYAKELLDGIFNSHSSSEIQYQLNAEKTELDIDKAIPLGLILNELVSNSLKHAFKNQSKGQLNINLKNEVDSIQLIVKDNGSGYNSDEQKADSMGLQLVKLLVQQLRGSFKIENKEGTLVNIIFQKSPILD